MLETGKWNKSSQSWETLAKIYSIAINEWGLPICMGDLALVFGIELPDGTNPDAVAPGKKMSPSRSPVEDATAAVRAGTVVTQAEVRTMLGLAPEPDKGQLLRFNDRDLLQYHVENPLLTINEIRVSLGWEKVPWGDVTSVEFKARFGVKDKPSGGGRINREEIEPGKERPEEPKDAAGER